MAFQITPLQTQSFSHGSGFTATGIRAPDAVLDPFLMIDHYRMSQPTFGAHPHAGFSAVTYMFDDAQTGFINRDSLGPATRIAPGDAHWSIAGSGIVHDEVPETPGQIAHGLQLFINLASADQVQPARALHFQSAQMPRIKQRGGADIKLAFGKFTLDQQSYALGELPVDVSLLDVKLMQAGDFFELQLDQQNAIVVPVSGNLRLADAAVEQPIALRGSDRIRLSTRDTAQFVMLLGTPLAQSVVRHGPFAMSNSERLRDAISRYQAGAFGTIYSD